MLGNELGELCPTDGAVKYLFAFPVDATDLKDVLCQINGN
jgi:hypothetical protein